MSRNFGVSSPRHVGAETIPGALFARDGGARESFIQLSRKPPAATLDDAIHRASTAELTAEHYRVMERAVKWFVILCAFLLGGAGCALLWVISLVLYYAGSDSPF